MFRENEKEWILETINHLKHRKARPDLSRISMRMKRKYQMSFAQTKKLLESLIESGIVVKAVYKNNTSYRDVSKWKKGRLGGQIMNSNKMLKRFIHAIGATEKGKGTGVSAKTIEDYLTSQGKEKCFLSGAALRDALENEISNGYLKKISVGTLICYTINDDNINNVTQLLEAEDEHVTSEEDVDSCKASPDSGHLLSNVLKAISETQQSEGFGSSLLDIKESLLIKGIKFADDSFLLDFIENSPKIKSIEDQGARTLYAIDEETSNLMVKNEASGTTKDAVDQCNQDEIDNKVSSSVKTESDLASFSSANIGSETERQGDYRSSSAVAPLRPPSKRRRIMKDHGPDFEIEMPTRMRGKTQDTKESVYPTPTASPASEKSEITLDQSLMLEAKKKRGRPKKIKSPSAERHLDLVDDDSKQDIHSESSSFFNDDDVEDDAGPEYPDISTWTSRQVADYFREKGYEEESQSMLEHELDGAALGLLRRSDIVGPPLGGILNVKKLGTALKLFRDIRDLLYQGNADNYVDAYEERAFLRS